MQFSVVTAEGVVTEGEAASITMSTKDGEITVLPNHIPLVSVLVPGLVTVRHQTGDDQHLAVSGGFANVTGSEVTLLADTAERADDIDIDRAEQARKRAEEVMSAKTEKQEVAEAAAAFAKNLARLQVAELVGKRRGRKGPRV